MTRLIKALLIVLLLVAVFFAVFIAFGAFGAPDEAKNAYFLQVDVMRADVMLSINGFPVNAKTPGQSVLRPLISPFLVDGKNTIDITYAPNEQSNERSELTWAIIEKPIADIMTTKDGKRLAEGSMGSRVVSWSEITEQDFTLTRGSIDGDHFFFQRDGRNAVSLGGRLSQAQAFTRLPSHLSYGYMMQPVSKASIHFKKSGTPIDIVFADLTLPGNGQGKIDLLPTAISSGKQWAMESGFDEILIEGETEKAYGPEVNFTDLSIVEIQGIRKDSRELTLELPSWHWQAGDRYTKLTEKDTAAIWHITQQYRQAIEAGDVPKQRTLLKDKMFSMKQFMPIDSKQWQEFERHYYTDIKGEKLKPISRSDAHITLVNPQVVKVTAPDSEPIIRSVPTNGAYMEVELFFSHLGGKWVISL